MLVSCMDVLEGDTSWRVLVENPFTCSLAEGSRAASQLFLDFLSRRRYSNLCTHAAPVAFSNHGQDPEER